MNSSMYIYRLYTRLIDTICIYLKTKFFELEEQKNAQTYYADEWVENMCTREKMLIILENRLRSEIKNLDGSISDTRRALRMGMQ